MAAEGSRKVLIAVDGSEAADNAFNWYLTNMKQANDYVYGITIPEYNFSGLTVLKKVGPLADPTALSQQFKEQHDKVEKLCADYTAKLRSAGVKGQVDASNAGKPGPTIVGLVDSLGIDAIVMGTRGLGALKRMVLGSVSLYVVQNCNVPVCVIPAKQK